MIDPRPASKPSSTPTTRTCAWATEKLMRRQHEGVSSVFKKHGIDAADLATHGDTLAELHKLLKRRSRKRVPLDIDMPDERKPPLRTDGTRLPEALVPDLGLVAVVRRRGRFGAANRRRARRAQEIRKTAGPDIQAHPRGRLRRGAQRHLKTSAPENARESAVLSSLVLRKYLSAAADDPALFETHEEFICPPGFPADAHPRGPRHRRGRIHPPRRAQIRAGNPRRRARAGRRRFARAARNPAPRIRRMSASSNTSVSPSPDGCYCYCPPPAARPAPRPGLGCRRDVSRISRCS
jgi:hypothetical protein